MLLTYLHSVPEQWQKFSDLALIQFSKIPSFNSYFRSPLRPLNIIINFFNKKTVKTQLVTIKEEEAKMINS